MMYDEICTNCGKPLNPKKMVMLEFHRVNLTYHEAGEVPQEYSQGFFPFGRDCAKKVKSKKVQ